MNPVQVVEAQDESPAVEVVGQRNGDHVVAGLQRQVEGTVFQGAAAIWRFHGRRRLIEILVRTFLLAVDKDPDFAGPANGNFLGLVLFGGNGSLEPSKTPAGLTDRQAILATDVHQSIAFSGDGKPRSRGCREVG